MTEQPILGRPPPARSRRVSEEDRGPVLVPDSPALADTAADWRFAYIHMPFCRRRCPYCDFAVVPLDVAPRGGPDFYLAAVHQEIDMGQDIGPLHGIYFGGGTPSETPAAGLISIVDHVAARFGLRDGAEISLEANPEDWSRQYAADLVASGFTRVSLGVQSFDDRVLRSLGRSHSSALARDAVQIAGDAGFQSVSVDLIYGTPGESPHSWQGSVGSALSAGVHHLSAYALTVEPGTDLAAAIALGAPAPDPDDQADKYEWLAAASAEAGLVRYEVSNHAAAGHPSRYSLATWAQGEYLGFGLGAHDHCDGIRSRNVRRLDRYLELVGLGQRPRAASEPLTDEAREQERILLGLRRAAGVRLGSLGSELVSSARGRRLKSAGVLDWDRNRVWVTNPLLTDEVSRTVLEVAEASTG